MTNRVLSIEQAVYGSRSGDRDYQTLAVSTRLARDERDVFEQHANLGGTALSGADVPPIYQFFSLGHERHGFTRAEIVPGGARGNDYVVHALILGTEVLQTLRGDLFLLDDLGLFSAKKPTGNELPSLALDARQLEEAASHEMGRDLHRGLELSHLATLLATLADGSPLATPIADGTFAVHLCRALLSALPPDDRLRWSFSTRYSQPRTLPFAFAAFVADDRPLVERYQRGALRPLTAAAETNAAVSQYLATLERGLEPALGFSLLADPARGAKIAKHLAALQTGESLRTEDGANPEAAVAVKIASDRRNEALPRFAQHRLPILASDFWNEANLAWNTGQVLLLFGAAQTTSERAPAADLFAPLAKLGDEAPRRAAELALAIVDPAPAPFRARFGRDGALFANAHEAAQWVGKLLQVSEAFAVAVLSRWFRRWREVERDAVLFQVADLLTELAPEQPLTPLLAALERAAPPSEEVAARKSWFEDILALVWRTLGRRFPSAFAARLVAQEGLWDALDAEEIEHLTPVLAAQLPQILDTERLAALDDSILGPLLRATVHGFRDEAWDLERAPERARLTERLAPLAAERPADLVIADLMMPGMDGLAFVAALRADARLAHARIVMITGYANVADEARTAGADVVLLKPITPAELLAAVETALTQH